MDFEEIAELLREAAAALRTTPDAAERLAAHLETQAEEADRLDQAARCPRCLDPIEAGRPPCDCWDTGTAGLVAGLLRAS